MFVIESVVGKTSELFFKAYGQTAIDPVTLAYYRYEWVVQEFGDYGERVFMTKNTGEETRADAVQGMKKLFAPDDVVEVAYEMDAGFSSRDTSWTLSDL
jgi:hypothetical protein